MEKVYVGIDVAKSTLDVALSQQKEIKRFANNEDGISSLVSYLKTKSIEIVVMEATGGLESLISSTLTEEGIPTAVVNPRQVRDFARAKGILAKTDAIDAHVLTEFARGIQPEVRALPDKQTLEIKALMTRRRQILEMITAERNRLHSTEKSVRPLVDSHIKWLKQQLKEIDKCLDDKIKSNPIWREKEDLLRSTPGVGPVLARTLIGLLPELGNMNGKQAALLVGVAPLNRDSGKLRGKRIVWGGRAGVRTPLYMSTLVATRCNPVIRSVYERLLKAGKAKKVALTACMRKLLTILNAMVRDNKAWQYAG